MVTGDKLRLQQNLFNTVSFCDCMPLPECSHSRSGSIIAHDALPMALHCVVMKRAAQELCRHAHVNHLSRCRVFSSMPGKAQEAPSKQQLRTHALQSAVPMIGFGIVDCVVMTQVGSTMDAVLGARLGISSITAAAIGLFCSDSCGVLFGGTIESFAGRLGLPSANLTSEQLEMPETKRMGTLGRLVGVQLGVLLGSTTLLLQGKPPEKLPQVEDENAATSTTDLPLQDMPPNVASTAAAVKTADVVVFARPGCPFCEEAENQLLDEGVAFNKVPHAVHRANLLEMTSSPAAPSIWVKGRYIGNKYQPGFFAREAPTQ